MADLIDRLICWINRITANALWSVREGCRARWFNAYKRICRREAARSLDRSPF